MSISRVTVRSIIFHRNASMSVALSDGRTITVPLEWYPRLANGKPSARRNWQSSAAGQGIHWPDLDEDLSIEGILHGIPSVEYRKPRRKSVKSSHPELRV